MFPLSHPELYEWLGVEPPRGVLLHGPPGCGKTSLAHAIAMEAGVSFFNIAATEVCNIHHSAYNIHPNACNIHPVPITSTVCGVRACLSSTSPPPRCDHQ